MHELFLQSCLLDYCVITRNLDSCERGLSSLESGFKTMLFRWADSLLSYGRKVDCVKKEKADSKISRFAWMKSKMHHLSFTYIKQTKRRRKPAYWVTWRVVLGKQFFSYLVIITLYAANWEWWLKMSKAEQRRFRTTCNKLQEEKRKRWSCREDVKMASNRMALNGWSS